MIRDIKKNLITKDKLMNSSDDAPIGCASCEGCGECCSNRGNSLTLDPFDIRLFKKAFGMSFQQLKNAGMIDFAQVNEIVLPVIGKKAGTDTCYFLGVDGRCQIHKIRPGLCRLFPLARIYHSDGSFSYFVQEGECPYGDGTPVNIEKWLGYKNIESYEKEVRAYHDRIVGLRKACSETDDEDELVKIKRKFLIDNFVKDNEISES